MFSFFPYSVFVHSRFSVNYGTCACGGYNAIPSNRARVCIQCMHGVQVSTFLIDSSRFRYPERAIVYLAICYLIVGCAYVAGLGAGDSAACREAFPPPIRLGKLSMYSTITMVSESVSYYIVVMIKF